MAVDKHPWLDCERIVEVLARHGVDYVLVGGVAAQLHGASRRTYDFDICPAYQPDNLSRLADALIELAASFRGDLDLLPPLSAQSLCRMQFGHWRTVAGDIDILLGLTGDGELLQHDTLTSRAVTRNVGGRKVLVACLAHMITSKQNANRPQDEEALGELCGLSEAAEKPSNATN